MNNRKVKYIIELFLKQEALIVIGSIVVTFYVWFLDSDISLADRFNKIPDCMIYMGVLTLIMYGVNNAMFYFQNHVAYGATRKTAFLDMVVIETLVLLVTYILYMIITTGKSYIVSLAVLMFGMGFGFLLGFVVLSLGRKGYYVFINACVLIGVISGVCLRTLKSNPVINVNEIAVLICGVAFVSIGIVLFGLGTRKKTIRI